MTTRWWFKLLQTLQKSNKVSLKLLNDAIEIIPNMLMLWDKENHLIMATKKQETSKKNGF